MPETDLFDAFRGAHLVVIANNHPVFQSFSLEHAVAEMASPSFVYDFWTNFNPREVTLPAGKGYVCLGSVGGGILPS